MRRAAASLKAPGPPWYAIRTSRLAFRKNKKGHHPPSDDGPNLPWACGLHHPLAERLAITTGLIRLIRTPTAKPTPPRRKSTPPIGAEKVAGIMLGGY